MFNFSYTQEKYDEVKEPLRYYLNWTNIKGNFKYKDCVITVIGMGDERKRIIVRRKIYEIMDKLRKKYSMHLQVLCPDTKEVEEMVNAKGQNLFYESTENRILCCKVRKVNPINRILPTLDGWITGIRKEHSKNRNSMQMFQIDEQHGGILKINPIIDWSLEQIMEQIRERQIPYNALLDQNYSSIGCAPCTRAIKPGEDLRAGRWWWESQGHSECGLHMNYTKKEENN